MEWIKRPDPDLIAPLTDVISRSFGVPLERTTAFLERVGVDEARAAREGGEVVGGMVLFPMGQRFGGRAVLTIGVAAVGVSPTYRRRGLARRMMRALLEEAHERGAPLSTLYASTLSLYRSVGYEQAGASFKAKIPAHQIGMSADVRAIRALREEDAEQVTACQRAFAARSNGQLDRNAALWARVTQDPDDPAAIRGYGYEVDGALRGYLYLKLERVASGRHDLHVTDMVSLDAEAARGLWAFLANHATFGADVHLGLAPWSLERMVLPEQDPLKITLEDNWCLRIVDVKAALEARGYPRGVTVEVHLSVIDDVLPHNHGRFILEVSGGKARVRPGGRGDLQIDVRGLASVYASHITPSTAGLAGLLAGPREAIEDLSLAFAGPQPWMWDNF